MSTPVPKSVGVALLASLAVLSIVACSPSDTGNGDGFDVSIRWTSHGIPHVKANDWGSLGYGFSYATATDAVCVIAKDVAMVSGRLSEFFGPEEGKLESDVFHRAVMTSEKLAAYGAAQSDRANQFSAGYVAGYNRYLSDHRDELPASCRGEAWVQEIGLDDVSRLAIGVGIRYGLGRYQKEIALASAAEELKVAQINSAPTNYEMPVGIGSNAVAVGRDLSESGRGMLLGNPHYPWHGSSRFHLIHTTIPGEVDVMGTSLLTTNRVSIGFNKDVAWTHTVSSALRSTLYRLELDPSDPTRYIYDGEVREFEPRTVTLMVKNEDGGTSSLEQTVHFSHFGPILETKELPWDAQHAYTLRDAVLDNYYSADTYSALNRATSTKDIEEAISKQGVFWVNTIAADRDGNAFFADISGTPNVDGELLGRCRLELPGLPDRLFILDGTTADCEWREDARSRVPGALPPDEMPRMTRDDYVTNSNDSYWLSNPSQPLEGYSPIIGAEKTQRSLRTRAGLELMSEMMRANEKLGPEDLQKMLFSHRNFGAELLLDDVLKVCGADSLASVCSALESWDRTMTIESRGGHVWREFWNKARRIENLYKVPFDVTDPVHTPRGINLADGAVARQVTEALVAAETVLSEAKIPLDAPLGEIQYAERNGKRIAIPGGEGWAGMFSMIVTRLAPDKGYTPIVHGNSFIQVISWDEDGKLDPRAMLTYSQSPEPESSHYSDLTEIYSAGGWITLPFTDEEIEADPNLRSIRLEG